MEICDACFKGSFHQEHPFLVQSMIDEEEAIWEPANREVKQKKKKPKPKPTQAKLEYEKLMRELQAKDELTPEDYEKLLRLEELEAQ